MSCLKITFIGRKEATLEVRIRVKVTWTGSDWLLILKTEHLTKSWPWPYFSLLKREKKLFNLANISECQILCQEPGILNQMKFDIEPKGSSEPCCLAGSVQNFLSWYIYRALHALISNWLCSPICYNNKDSYHWVSLLYILICLNQIFTVPVISSCQVQWNSFAPHQLSHYQLLSSSWHFHPPLFFWLFSFGQ